MVHLVPRRQPAAALALSAPPALRLAGGLSRLYLRAPGRSGCGGEEEVVVLTLHGQYKQIISVSCKYTPPSQSLTQPYFNFVKLSLTADACNILFRS